jgi:transmembrane 9 superfamily protein 2/4
MNVQEDQGWKLLHGEVFRAPSHPLVLSTMVGTGAQLSAMVAVTLVFALFGFLSPSLRGSLASTMLVFWTLFSCINGYVSTRIYLSFGGEAIKKLAFLSATLFPTYVLCYSASRLQSMQMLTRASPFARSSIIFAVIFLLNLFLVGAGSSGAIPFGTILAVVALWFLISVPLAVAGVWLGIRHGALEHPTRVNPIPRQIPPGPTYLKKWPAAALAGLLPWAAAFVELFFVLSSLFGSKAYYAFGFLFLTLCIVILVRTVRPKLGLFGG